MEPSCVNSSIISGFSNYSLSEHIEFSRWKETVAKVYDQYGFVRFESRKVERASNLTKKGGDDREIYAITHYKGGDIIDEGATAESTLCLPFDRTVPMAIFFANNPCLPLPLKRQDIDYSWRVEKAQLGRFKAFVQADVDVIDRNLNILAEAECIKAIIVALNGIGISQFNMYLNHIGIAKALVGTLKLDVEKSADALRTIDKLDKISPEEAIEQLEHLAPDVAKETLVGLVDMFKFRGNIADFREAFEKDSRMTDEIRPLLNEVSSLMKLLQLEGIDSKLLCFSPGMVRGLEYYTGVVFETFLTDAPLRGSIASGGRYDNLVDAVSASSTETKIKGFGGSIGLTRLFALCTELNMIAPNKMTAAKVLICYRKLNCVGISPLQEKGAELANRVRMEGVATDLYTNSENNVKKQLRYANDRKFDNVVVVMEESIFVVKDMVNAKEKEVKSIAAAVDVLMQHIALQTANRNLEQYADTRNPSGKAVQAPQISGKRK